MSKGNESVTSSWFIFPFPFSFLCIILKKNVFKTEYQLSTYVPKIKQWNRNKCPGLLCTTVLRIWGILWHWEAPELWSLKLTLVFPEVQKCWKLQFDVVINKRTGKLQGFPAQEVMSESSVSCESDKLSELLSFLNSFLLHIPYATHFLGCLGSISLLSDF